jgi:hypothetical protein
MSDDESWTFERYWSAVLGEGEPADVLARIEWLPIPLRPGLHDWLGRAEQKAWKRAGGSASSGMPEEWAEHHRRALEALVEAGEDATRKVQR